MELQLKITKVFGNLLLALISPWQFNILTTLFLTVGEDTPTFQWYAASSLFGVWSMTLTGGQSLLSSTDESQQNRSEPDLLLGGMFLYLHHHNANLQVLVDKDIHSKCAKNWLKTGKFCQSTLEKVKIHIPQINHFYLKWVIYFSCTPPSVRCFLISLFAFSPSSFSSLPLHGKSKRFLFSPQCHLCVCDTCPLLRFITLFFLSL